MRETYIQPATEITSLGMTAALLVGSAGPASGANILNQGIDTDEQW